MLRWDEKVGNYFMDGNGDIWQMISYCKHPTVTLKKVGREDRINAAVGSSFLNDKNLVEVTVDQENIIRKVETQFKEYL